MLNFSLNETETVPPSNMMNPLEKVLFTKTYSENKK